MMKNRNVGIDLLRILMAFAVVGVHCLVQDRTQAGSFAVRACLAILILCPVVVCRHGPGYSYSGLQDVLFAVSAIGTFLFLPLEHLPGWVGRVLSVVAACSMGVYMTHVVLARLCEKYVFCHIGLAPKTLLETFDVFVLSWVFCFLLARIPYCRRLVI